MKILSKVALTVLLGVSTPIYAAMDTMSRFDDEVGSGIIWRDQYNDPLILPKSVRSTGEKVFVFSPRARQWAAYNGAGRLVGYGRANGGASFCAELNEPCLTANGRYHVFRKGDSSCISNTFPLDQGGGAAMPYCMFFNGGAAIHGSPQLSLMNSSHGCVRVTTPSARWLSESFINVGTKVLVTSY